MTMAAFNMARPGSMRVLDDRGYGCQRAGAAHREKSRMKLDIPAGDFAGYIFDLDGTLVDTMPLHYRAWNRAMQLAGLKEELSEDFFYSLGGMPTRRVAAVFAQHYGLTIDVDKVFHKKEALFLELQTEMRVIDAVVAV